MAMPPRWKRPRFNKLRKHSESDGPGLLFILVALVAVAVAGARLLGFTPGMGTETVQTRIVSPLDVSRSDPAPDTPSSPAPAEERQPVATVLVYHAHATENYGPAATHAQGGRAGHVVDVGRTFAAWLDDGGVQAI